MPFEFLRVFVYAMFFSFAANPVYAVYNGQSLSRSEYSASLRHVAKLYRNDKLTCNATLILKNFAVTAAHCVDPKKKLSLTFATDATDESWERIEVVDFRATSLEQDFAILKLKRVPKWSKPVAIAVISEEMMINASVVSDYIQTGSTHVIQGALLNISEISSFTRAKKFIRGVGGNITVKNESSSPACRGDSGAGLIKMGRSDAESALVGVKVTFHGGHSLGGSAAATFVENGETVFRCGNSGSVFVLGSALDDVRKMIASMSNEAHAPQLIVRRLGKDDP